MLLQNARVLRKFAELQDFIIMGKAGCSHN